MAEKLRILLVDDEPNILKIISKRLSSEGYEVLAAVDGEEALHKARTQKPDLIILDVMLPKLSGYQVCVQLKRDVQYQKIPIIMLTALAQDTDEEFGYEMGTDVYMRKPFRAQALLDKIKELLTKDPQTP